MARTKAEIRAFLDSKVGTIVPHPAPYQDLRGQCVTLEKALLEFLGVPNPYAARGNARDAGDTLLRQGIAEPGAGWLTIIVNRDMGLIDGVRYGHIWIDLKNEANYESNGRIALTTTKNTRPWNQGQQFINLDKWVGEEVVMPTPNEVVSQFRAFIGSDPTAQQVEYYSKRSWGTLNDDLLVWNRDRRLELQNGVANLNNLVAALNKQIQELKANDAGEATIADLQKRLQAATDQANAMKQQLDDKNASDVKAEEGILAALRAFWRILNKK